MTFYDFGGNFGLSSYLGCIQLLIGLLPLLCSLLSEEDVFLALRVYDVVVFVSSAGSCFCFCFLFVFLFYFIRPFCVPSWRRCPPWLAGYFLVRCLLSAFPAFLRRTYSRFDLFWFFRLSRDPGWIRSRSVNMRYCKQQQKPVRKMSFPNTE